MSLEDRIEEEAKQRFLTVPSVKFEPESVNPPVSNRMYSALEVVSVSAIKEATAQVDTEDSVIAPMGAFIPLGYEDAEGSQVLGDLIPVPTAIAGTDGDLILSHCQIPIMIDKAPIFEHEGEREIDFGRLPEYTDYHSSVLGQEKAVEQVLAIPAANYVQSILNREGTEIVSWAAPIGDNVYLNTAFVRRGWCETDARFIQFLPYITFYKKMADGSIKLFVYQRGKGVGEERLALGCSIGVGGHVNPVDFLSMQIRLEKHPSQADLVKNVTGRLLVETFWGGILNNVFRELTEEVSVSGMVASWDKTENPQRDVIDMQQYIAAQAVAENISLEEWLHKRTSFFLDYASGDVEKVHLGMFIAIEVPEDFTITTCEDVLHDVGFVDLNDLYCAEGAPEAPWGTPTPLECWSRSIVNALYETKKFAADNNVELKAKSNFMRNQLKGTGQHLVDSETVAKIPAADRWKIGTISSSFGDEYRFYDMNAFLRA